MMVRRGSLGSKLRKELRIDVRAGRELQTAQTSCHHEGMCLISKRGIASAADSIPTVPSFCATSPDSPNSIVSSTPAERTTARHWSEQVVVRLAVTLARWSTIWSKQWISRLGLMNQSRWEDYGRTLLSSHLHLLLVKR